jgi:excisionase family DNA binding protein
MPETTARPHEGPTAVVVLQTPVLPRLALSKAEAAEVLGVSVDFFEEHIQPDLKIVYKGRRRLIPVRELEKWLEANGARAAMSR